MNLPRYRYANDKSDRTFTESEWLHRSWDSFIREDESDIEWALFLIGWFSDLVQDDTILPLDGEKPKRKGPFDPSRREICRHPMDALSHLGRSLWRCGICGWSGHKPMRQHFCTQGCLEFHSLTFAEAIAHDREFHLEYYATIHNKGGSK